MFTGFNTDFSSIPQCCAWLVRWSKVDVAGVFHDALYAREAWGVDWEKRSEEPCERMPLSRKDSDKVWRDIAMMGRHRANWLQAHLGYLALRVGGGPAWRRHRKNG